MLEFVAGSISGVLSSMGMGGGSILVMLLSGVLGVAQQKAQGINLIYFLPVASLSVWRLRKDGILETKTALLIVAGGLPIAILFCFLALRTNGELLRKMFGMTVFLYGIYSLAKADVRKA